MYETFKASVIIFPAQLGYIFAAGKKLGGSVLFEKTILFKSYSPNPGNFVIGNSTIAHQISAQDEF